MKMFSAQDIQNVLNVLSNDPSNAQAYSLLTQMMNEQLISREPYVFPVNFTLAQLVASATNVQGSFFVDASSPFMLVEQNYMAGADFTTDQTEATAMVPLATVSIQEQSSNRNWQSSAVHVGSWFGRGREPFYLPQPRLIPANTTVTITANNLDTNSAIWLSLAFIGFRLYA